MRISSVILPFLFFPFLIVFNVTNLVVFYLFGIFFLYFVHSSFFFNSITFFLFFAFFVRSDLFFFFGSETLVTFPNFIIISTAM